MSEASMQNINLYQPPQAAADGRPRPRLLALAAVVLALAILADGVWHYWRLQQLQGEVSATRQAAEQAEAALAARRASFREPQPDPRLPLQLAALEADNRQLQRMGEYLQGLIAERSGGFSATLDALAERHMAGLWLSGIRLEQGGRDLLLEGASQKAELLPDYLGSLGRSPAFSGRQFARFDLDRDDAGVLRFRLDSQQASPEEVAQ